MTNRKAYSDQIEAITKRAEVAEQSLTLRNEQYEAASYCVTMLENQNEAFRDKLEAAEAGLKSFEEHHAVEVAGLRAKLSESQKDTERLDWLESQRFGCVPGMPKRKHDYWFIQTYDGRPTPEVGDTLRAALNAARGKA